MVSKKLGMMFVLSSPSGVGKTTLTKMLEKSNSNYTISVSHTTRQPRQNEQDGKDYYFVNNEKFEELIENGSFFEYAVIFGNYYGTLKKTVLHYQNIGKDVLFDIDWQGTQQLKKKVDNSSLVTIFILPPNIETLKNRLVNRDQFGKQLAEERMKKFREEVSHWNEYDYVVINNDLDECFNKLVTIIDCEKKGKKYQYSTKAIEKLVKSLKE